MTWRLQDYGLWADDAPEPQPKRTAPMWRSHGHHWPTPQAKELFREELLYVHQKLVSLNDQFGEDERITPKSIARSLGYGSEMTHSYRYGIVNLSLEWFDSRPLNSRKIVSLATRLRMIDVSEWAKIIRYCGFVTNEVEVKDEQEPW